MKHYICDKETNDNVSCNLTEISINGFKIKPKNQIKYDGILVSSLTVTNPVFIENILKRKTKRKLNAYLQFLIESLEDDTTSGDELALILEDAMKYRMMIIERYAKYLKKSDIKELIMRVNFIEEELRMRIYNYHQNFNAHLGKGR